MTGERVLLVDDEVGIRELIHLYLEKKDYQVLIAENGVQALKLAESEKPYIILLDIEMPGKGGFDVCKQIRETTDVPILFISCRRSSVDKIKGFEVGGDDYITKPFDFAELEARIKANLRRNEWQDKKQGEANILIYDELEIHLDSCEIYMNGEPVSLFTKELQLLLILAQRPNQVWSTEKLYDQIWGFESAGDIQTVKVHISNLRRKLESDPAHPKFIQTVRGFGYKFSW